MLSNLDFLSIRRYRPDIRKLENNDLDGAAAEKTRLEEKQREVRSLRKRKKIPEWSPRYKTTLSVFIRGGVARCNLRMQFLEKSLEIDK